MKKNLILLVLLLTFCIGNIFPQIDSVKYTFEFNFKEGLYLTYDEFKNNSPSIKDYKVIAANGLWLDQFDNNTRIKRIECTDQEGRDLVLKEKDMWGLCRDGQVFVYAEDAFQKILRIGALMSLTMTFDNVEFVSTFSATGSGIYPSGNNKITYTYLIDFETGTYHLFKLKEFLKLIECDQELYEEFTSIRGKKKKQYKLRMYLEKFNERNPIYFKVNPFYQFN